MSVQREEFHANVVAKRYDAAILNLNGLNMAEMLPALAAIGDTDPEKHRTQLIKALLGAVGKVNVPRIQYALSVVQDLALPPAAPGDLEATRQVEDARLFVAVPAVSPLTFATADAAAIAVITAINPTSLAQNREFWGLIFKRGSSFGFTSPTRSPDETAATPIFSFPMGTQGVAVYHTHGAGFRRKNGSNAAEGFSIDDRMVCKKNDVDGYLGTPDQHILKLAKPPSSARANLWELGKVSSLR